MFIGTKVESGNQQIPPAIINQTTGMRSLGFPTVACTGFELRARIGARIAAMIDCAVLTLYGAACAKPARPTSPLRLAVQTTKSSDKTLLSDCNHHYLAVDP
ncbi:hypothetical protein J6590_057371 [Homalodisca vitripennis]|nr:hypothetical protein J6590_057371 [Homalodisca vitripennis]